MVTVGGTPEVVFVGLTILFIFSQAGYFIGNLMVALTLYLSPAALVTDDTPTPAIRPPIHILMPIYREQEAVIRESLVEIFEADYPPDRLNVYLIYEDDDAAAKDYLDDLVASVETHGGTIETLCVDRPSLAIQTDQVTWEFSGELVPRTKAAALKYAFRVLSFTPGDVITVFDADTVVPDDSFELAVAGLDRYDVVQMKQTVRNVEDGLLPTWEAMGMAGWSRSIYQKTTGGPYQLLGKGYFIQAEDLYRLDDWDVSAITEDLTLGIDAYTAGYSLGIVDRYVQDLCPTTFEDWVEQKRRWVAGPYPYLRYEAFDWLELARFWTYSIFNQFISVINVVGVPAGLLYLLFTLLGFPIYYSLPLAVITTFNLVSWVYYSLQSYLATESGVRFRSSAQRLYYYVVSNPFTQLLYSTLWVVPIVLAVWDYVIKGEERGFSVTPKSVSDPPTERQS
ncbi:MAG: glycosyltransferase family 2 protein [Halobacteriaceae archaeon]